MKTFLFIFLFALTFSNATCQLSFSPVESKLNSVKGNNITELVCSGSALSVKFQLKRSVTISPQNNIVTVDGQTIQITPLKFSVNKQDTNDEKSLLATYSKYELDYFKNDLGMKLINSSNQWVVIKSKGWFIWYFKVVSVPVKTAQQTKIQLFASTVIGDNILTINAPIFKDEDFDKAGLIVNEMMETLKIIK